MNAEQIRSVGCGPVGAIISALIASIVFHWQAKRWSTWIPTKVWKKGRELLLEENKSTLRIAKVLSVVGLCTGCLFYAGWISKYDWRGLGLGFGLACFLPITYIVLANVKSGAERIKEAMVALAIADKTPTKVFFALSGLCLIGGVASAVSLLLGRR
jgi:hypothetical protein